MDLAALRRWWPLAAVAVLLGVAAFAAGHSSPQLERIEPGLQITIGPDQSDRFEDVARPPQEAPAGVPEDPGAGLPEWVTRAALIVVGVLAAGVVLLVVAALVRDQLRRRARRPGPRAAEEPAAQPADDVVAALDAGLQDLSDTDRDPRRAVIACWVRLEQAAAAAGTPRRPGDTPADLVGRLLAEQRVAAGVLADLAGVYRQARYATHLVDERMRADARDALQRLRADLSTGPRA
ncbi:DUF4129 domain-containing protein [Spirilliplanes yamanashiensis]|nr:DUF4129 domain-containing protein [Spirilliplanes yamanashiensis]MDP9816043.1 hypothetical protein [Spirilliplanes yamanashiensis]